jgi:chorismate dehydratase
MQKIKVSAVLYLNSAPFIFGLNNSPVKDEIELSLDIPSTCAEKLINGSVDIGLIPVAAILELKESHIISDYCIGAVGQVNSVMLVSEFPLQQIKTILLDYQSRTSSLLIQILSKNHWHIHPDFKNATEGYEKNIKENVAGLIIGDRALIMKKNFKYAFDLSEAWFEMTSLPFVFACWVANKKLENSFIKRFNFALKYGIDRIDKVIAQAGKDEIPNTVKQQYLNKNMSYFLDDKKNEGMNLFFDYVSKLKVAADFMS